MEKQILGILSKVQNKEIDIFAAFEDIHELNAVTEQTLESIEGHIVQFENNTDTALEVMKAIVETLKDAGRLPFAEMKGSDKYFSFGVIGNSVEFGAYQVGDEEETIRALTVSYVTDIDFHNTINKIVELGKEVNDKTGEIIN